MEKNVQIYNFLKKHANKKPISFHMPGHKGSALYKRFGYGDFLKDFMDFDITEIPGADNLFQTEGIIKELQDQYADLYEVKNSYLLVNGTSGGIIASILASVRKGGTLIMARNCHKSVFNALTLGDIKPAYAYPETDETYGISGPIQAEEIRRLLDENEHADAVILPSPNYYGICSDIKSIAEEVHKHNKILIVDQAHGAHLKFFHKYHVTNMPLSAEEAGADLVINSTHKTLASLTQSAILNRNSDRTDPLVLEDKLQCIESTSPSYVLMASLDINCAIIRKHGEQLIKEWNDNLNYFYENAKDIKGLDVIGKIPSMDWSKINFSLGRLGISGATLERKLMGSSGIFIELFTGDLVMCMTGIGNTKGDIEKLLCALTGIAKDIKGQNNLHYSEFVPLSKSVQPPKNLNTMLYNIPKERKLVPLHEADQSVCAGSIIPYPPGIPLLCPGEKFSRESIDYIEQLRQLGEKVIGVTADGCVFVGI